MARRRCEPPPGPVADSSLIERVRRCARHRPLLVCTDGLCASVRAIRETCREPERRGAQGRPRLRPWRHVCIAQVVTRYQQRRVVAVERRIVEGTAARVETLRRRSPGDGVIHTADIERLNATFRERLAALTRRGRALAPASDLASGDVYNRYRLEFLHPPCESAGGWQGYDACHGGWYHRSWLDLSLFRLIHRLPRGQAHAEVMQGTAEFHHDIADALLPEADPVFDNATALDTAVHVLDPQPTVMQGLVGPLLFQGEFLTTGFLGGHEDLDLGQRKREEAQIL